jgi:hypothetical protein
MTCNRLPLKVKVNRVCSVPRFKGSHEAQFSVPREFPSIEAGPVSGAACDTSSLCAFPVAEICFVGPAYPAGRGGNPIRRSMAPKRRRGSLQPGSAPAATDRPADDNLGRCDHRFQSVRVRISRRSPDPRNLHQAGEACGLPRALARSCFSRSAALKEANQPLAHCGAQPTLRGSSAARSCAPHSTTPRHSIQRVFVRRQRETTRKRQRRPVLPGLRLWSKNTGPR